MKDCYFEITWTTKVLGQEEIKVTTCVDSEVREEEMPNYAEHMVSEFIKRNTTSFVGCEVLEETKADKFGWLGYGGGKIRQKLPGFAFVDFGIKIKLHRPLIRHWDD